MRVRQRNQLDSPWKRYSPIVRGQASGIFSFPGNAIVAVQHARCYPYEEYFPMLLTAGTP